MVTIGKIIVFKVLAKNNKLLMNKFCRKFWGYKDRSNNYKYEYKRNGYIDQFSYIKPLRGVLVVKKEDAGEIISFLESYNADIYARDIILLNEDQKALMTDKKGGI